MDELLTWLNGLGFSVPNIKLDGNIIRFGDKQCAWFVGHEFPAKKAIGKMLVIATVGDWKTSELHRFRSDIDLNRAEEKKIKEFLETQRARLERERETAHKQSADDAVRFFESFHQGVSSTEYTNRKKVSMAPGVRVGNDEGGEFLAIPLRDVDGKLWTFQKVYGDGQKRFFTGGRKKGCFFQFGTIENHVYIAEGYATASSIYEAGNSAAIAAIDAGNIPSVAQAIRARYPDIGITYCADRDDSGVGEKKCGEARALTLGEVILPPEPYKDFNDAAQVLGKEILPKEKTLAPVIIPLGFSGETHFYTSTYLQTVSQVTSFSTIDLLKLMPLEYWETKFPGHKTNVDWPKAQDWLITMSSKKGGFDEANIRGLGVWDHDGATVTHLGDRLDANGSIVPLQALNKDFVYIRDTQQPDLAKPMPKEESKVLWEICSRLETERPEHRIFLAGWLACARLAGLLPWRPHLWVSGESGSGKTTVLRDIIAPMMGDMVRTFSGGTTEAGMRQSMRSMAVPVIYDEFESNDFESAKLVKRCLEFIRQASSDAAFVYKGTSNGASTRYRARFCAVLGSIRANLELQEDRSRFTLVELRRRDDSGRQEHFRDLEFLMGKLTPDFADRFFARMVRGFDAFKASMDVFRTVMTRKHPARFAEQHTPMLAGYWAISNDGPVPIGDAERLVEECWSGGLESEAVDDEPSEHEGLLEFIMASNLDVEGPHGRQAFTIAQICKKILDSDVTRQWRLALNNAGMTVVSREGEFYPNMFHIRCTSPTLKRLLRDEPRYSNWTQLLRRVKGAEKNVVAKYHMGSQSGWAPAKGTLVPFVVNE